MTLANPRALPEGELITEPGVYDLPIEVYHGQPCAGPSISSGGLRTIWAQSPAHYYVDSALNPDREPPTDNPAFALGRLAHKLLLEGSTGLEAEFITRPDCWDSWRTKDSQVWRDEQTLAGKTIITEADLKAVTGMATSLARHPLVDAGILDGYVERSLVWQDAATGVWLKSRPDVVPKASGLFSDLKTTPSVCDDDLQRSLGSFGYHCQAALVGMASEAVLGRPMEEFALVWVEKAPPFCVRVTVLTGEDLERGRMQCRRAIDQFAACLSSGEWPGPGGSRRDAEHLQLPAWAAKRIDQQLEIAAAEANDNARQPEKAA